MFSMLRFAFTLTIEVVVAVYITIWLFKQDNEGCYALGIVWIILCICAGIDWILKAKVVENREKEKQWFREPGTILGKEVVEVYERPKEISEEVWNGLGDPMKRTLGVKTTHQVPLDVRSV